MIAGGGRKVELEERRTAVLHPSLNLIVTAVYAAGFAWRYKVAHPAPVPVGQIALAVVSLAVLTVSGFLGGKLAYRYGVRVADEATQAEGAGARGGPSRPRFIAGRAVPRHLGRLPGWSSAANSSPPIRAM